MERRGGRATRRWGWVAVLYAGCLAASPAAGQPTATTAPLEPCLACHGATGESSLPLTPSLGGQPSFFVITQLFLFREARRDNEQMVALAKAMSDNELRAFSEAVSKLAPPRPPSDGRDAARYERGAALAILHRCNVCHSADFSGQQQVPRLANQREDYLLKAMREFKANKRKGYGGAMAVELMPLQDEGLIDVAHFLAHFRAAAPR